MPGVVGIVRSRAAHASIGEVRKDSPALDAAVQTLKHLDGYSTRKRALDGVELAQVWRPGCEKTEDWFADPGGDVSVAITGHVLVDRPHPGRIYARDICEDYQKLGKVPAEQYDGGFVIVVVDRRRQRLLVYNDRIGTLPVHFAEEYGVFCFAPESKAIFAALGNTPRLSKTGVVTFLSIGYCLADTTIFVGIRVLEPANVLSVDLENGRWTRERYWNLEFVKDRSLRSERAVVNEMYDALVKSHRLILVDNPKRYDVMLSGGLDSRGVVAFTNEIGRPPDRTFSWGLRADIPHSDAYIARQVSDHYGIPYEFLSYDTDAFLDNFISWCYISELANDNIGWFSEGQPVLASAYSTRADFTIAGDITLHKGGYAFRKNEMLPNNLTPATALHACLTDKAKTECPAIYQEQLDAVWKSCRNEDLTDRKDYMYLNGRMARFIMSLGYYKEMAIEIRRPFLTKAVLDLYSRLPNKHRMGKIAYISMMKRKFEDVMRIPEQSVSSLPDWEYDLRKKQELRNTFLGYLDPDRVESGVLGGIVDGRKLATQTSQFFDAEAVPESHEPPAPGSPVKKRIAPFVKRHRNIYRISRMLGTSSVIKPRNNFDFLRGVALVTLMEEQLPAFSSQGKS